MSAAPAIRRSPRFVVRVLAASFATVVLVLAAVFTVLILHTRSLVQRSVVDNLEAGQRLLAMFERERQHEGALQATVLTESPTLKAALDVWQSEMAMPTENAASASQAVATVENEVNRLASLLQADVVAVVGIDGRVIASAGPRAPAWRARQRVTLGDSASSAAFETVVTLGSQTFRTTVAPLQLGGSWIGDLVVGASLDEHYAAQLSNVARTSVAVVADGRVIASTLAAPSRAAFEMRARQGLDDAGVLSLGDEDFAYRRLQQIGPTAFYALDSTTAASDRVSRDALPKLAAIAFGGVILCLLASVRLARTVSAPIDHLSRELAAMADAHTPGPLAPAKRTSHEIETLTATFNRLIKSLADARAETDAAYVGAIRALAAALDARDAYTSGHSERVSALAVAIGEEMNVAPKDLEVLRLGALLHDIGKIGISDDILGKPGPLSAEEFEVIKTHPTLGAQILRSVPFLEPHLAIVELHHEQPDGRGYPHGLRGHEIPILARIVHVADAFDAMTTARAYRAGRPAAEALAVLWRHAGSQFDLEAVQALSATLPAILRDMTAASEERYPAEVVRFERRAAEA
jgi:putative nucleotidyltransferase with HDIG domain